MPDSSFRKVTCIAIPRFWSTPPGQSVVAPVVGATYTTRKPHAASQWCHFWDTDRITTDPCFIVGERYFADAFTDEYAAPEEAAEAKPETANVQMQHQAAASLLKYLDTPPKETIDGVTVESTAEMVMLEIEYTPVLVEAHYEHSPDIPRPCRASKTEGDTYIVYAPSGPQVVSARELQAMRARFLLWNGYLYKLMAQGRLLPHPKADQYVAWYQGGSLHIPQVLIDHYRKQAGEPEQAQEGTTHV